MALIVNNLIQEADFNNLLAQVTSEISTNRRNITSVTMPGAVIVDEKILANSINPIINVLNLINEDLTNMSSVTASTSLARAIESLATTTIDLAGRDMEGSNSGCKSGCTGLCEGCTGSCIGTCDTGCTGDCAGGCSGSCSGSCTSCSGCTSCSSCYGTCSSCSGGCTGCGNNCSTGCGIDCTNSCEVNCAYLCQINAGLL